MSRRWFERLLFAARWLLAPFYVALVVALLALLAKVGVHVYQLVAQFTASSEDQILLSALGVVDLTLSASLIVIVILSGYVNFVAPIDIDAHKDWPRWFADIDFSELKLKLIASIVAITAIKLLESYMNVDSVSDRDFAWQTGVLIAFVVTALLLALADRLGRGEHTGEA
ncbi:MAG: TIGR00645 family protein [Bradyrhizobium sp.]|jgi:uncharacterized protein (TIGR00645 family)|nr:MAG: TIGR00645 family protein [Bradyrhizobium sp.]